MKFFISLLLISIKKTVNYIFLIFVFAGFIFAQADSNENKNNNSSRITPETKLCYITAKKGDTVNSIAERLNVSAAMIARYNGLFTVSKLPEGREIMIFYKEGNRPSECGPSKRKFVEDFKVVRAELGDTVESLACRYNVSPEEVAAINKLSINSRLLFGQKITIPAKKDYKCVNQAVAKLFR